MTGTTNRLGFERVNIQHGDGHRSMARFVCHSCEKELDVPLLPLAPEAMSNLAKRKGWEAHPLRKDDARCPECQNERRSKRVRIKDNIVSIAPQQQPTPVAVPEPTSDQRYAIRQRLDTCFDDKMGAYLDGMTDQKIGAALNIPAIMVTRIREAAYGPIRVDEATLEFNRRIAAAEALVRDAQSMVHDAIKMINEAKEEYEKKRKVA